MSYAHALKNRRGFTLVELLIVIIIIAVLAAIAIPKFSNSSIRSKESALRSNLKLVRNAVDLFRNDTGVYPGTLGDLAAVAAPANGLNASGANTAINATDWRGPYIEKIPVDSVTGGALNYDTTSPNVGRVRAAATGNGSDGTDYQTW